MPQYTISQMVNATIDDYVAKNKKNAKANDPEVMYLNDLKKVFEGCRSRESLVKAIAILEQTPFIEKSFMSGVTKTNLRALLKKDSKLTGNILPDDEIINQLEGKEYFFEKNTTPFEIKMFSDFPGLLKKIHAQTTKLLKDARIVPIDDKDLNAILRRPKFSSDLDLTKYTLIRDIVTGGFTIEGYTFPSRDQNAEEKVAAIKELANQNDALVQAIIRCDQNMAGGINDLVTLETLDVPKVNDIVSSALKEEVSNVVMFRGALQVHFFKDQDKQVYMQINNIYSGYTIIGEQQNYNAFLDLEKSQLSVLTTDELIETKKIDSQIYPTIETSILVRFDLDENDNTYKPHVVKGYNLINDKMLALRNPENVLASTSSVDISDVDIYDANGIADRLSAKMEGIYNTQRQKLSVLTAPDSLKNILNNVDKGVAIQYVPLEAKNALEKSGLITGVARDNFSSANENVTSYADFILFHGQALKDTVVREFENKITVGQKDTNFDTGEFKTVNLHYFRNEKDELVAEVRMNVYAIKDLETGKIIVMDPKSRKLQTYDPVMIEDIWKNGPGKSGLEPIGNFIMEATLEKSNNYVIPKLKKAECTINTSDITYVGKKLYSLEEPTSEASNENKTEQTSAPQFKMGGPG